MNRVKMINAFGHEMWVAEDRVEEYLAAGHSLAAEAEKPASKTQKKAVKRKTVK